MKWSKNLDCKTAFTGFRMRTQTGCFAGLAGFLTGLWAFLMLTVFPLYMKNHYSKLGAYKFDFFLKVSLYCLLPALAFRILQQAAARKDHLAVKNTKRQALSKTAAKGQRAWKQRLSALDLAVLFYLLTTLFSWFFSIDRQRAWIGADGWFMGLRTQLLFGLAYFMVSRCFPWDRLIFAGHFLTSGVVFMLGILHRFRIDPLGMYRGLDESYQLRFLSTIGQASWYSSYVCIVLVIGIVLFFQSEKMTERLALGAYCMLGFGTVVTQNSDSAFAALAFLFLGLFLTACDSLDRMERFFETLLLMLGSFKIIGFFQMLFPQKAMQLGGLSAFLSQSTGTWVLFLMVCFAYMGFLLYRQKNPGKMQFLRGSLLKKTAVGMTVLALTGYILLVWLNTTGRLAMQSTNGYLLFDRNWGNSRGFIWKFTADTFNGFPMMQKLFGAGPDCFSAYCYADASRGAYLNHFFGQNQTLTNAHNEFLNALFCLGIVGLLAYMRLFITAVCRFYRNLKKQPLVLLGMLAVLVYSAHNFFCYQQVCCTPFLWLLLGMAENLLRREERA